MNPAFKALAIALLVLFSAGCSSTSIYRLCTTPLEPLQVPTPPDTPDPSTRTPTHAHD